MNETEISAALDDVRALVQADGGDLVLVGSDPASGEIHLSLVLEGVECRECVMPRDFLEPIALDMIGAKVPAVTVVRIDDPREHE